jgi:hypothetical protein
VTSTVFFFNEQHHNLHVWFVHERLLFMTLCY